MARRKYTDEDRANALVVLTTNEGNVKRTARDTGIPIATVRMWKKDWARKGPSEEVALLAEQQAERFLVDATRARDLALRQWEHKVEAGEVAARDLMTGVGVLTDKLNIAKGLTRDAPERVAVEPAAMRAIAEGMIRGVLADAREREGEILDAEYEEVASKELNSGTS